MTGPGPEVAIETDDLRSDAALWRDGATTISSVSNLVAAQNPSDSAFMMVGIAVAAGYRELRDQLLQRLADGHAQFTTLSTVLVELAEEYDGYEENASSVITDLGDVFE